MNKTQSFGSGVTRTEHNARHAAPNRELATRSRTVEAQRHSRQPLLVKQWKYLWRRELVELRRGSSVLGSGYVDEATADASTIWIHLTQGQGRMLIHLGDGIDIWRIDPRICQDRVQA
jgi:hypothetical protein